MKFYSTNNQTPAVDFREATLLGQPPDKGLYFPGSIPSFSTRWLEDLPAYSHADIVFDLMKPYTGDTIPDDTLYEIAHETISFPVPLALVTPHISALELFHGPTLAFKDVGARFMSRCLSWFVRQESKRVVILVATSGDTGGAVAHGFLDVPGIDVVILYPSGKVSPVQEKQLTTLGSNIRALEIEGDFDDCQRMVKSTFAIAGQFPGIMLSSANSINVARWLPQQCYYVLAYSQWKDKGNPPVIAVPSGNFGNICAGLLAYKSGLPVHHFIAACNENDVVPRFLETGKYEPHPTIATISNAMDVSAPSNFVRIMELFDHDVTALKNVLSAIRITEKETMDALASLDSVYQYQADPHGGVAFAALTKYLQQYPGKEGIFLETAHPVKFPDTVLEATGKEVTIPPALHVLLSKEKKAEKMPAEDKVLHAYLKQHFA